MIRNAQHSINVGIKRFAVFAIKHVSFLFYSVRFLDFDLYLDVSIKNKFMGMYVCISHGFHASYFIHISRKTTTRLIYGGRLTINLNWNSIISFMPSVWRWIPECTGVHPMYPCWMSFNFRFVINIIYILL